MALIWCYAKRCRFWVDGKCTANVVVIRPDEEAGLDCATFEQEEALCLND